MLASLWKSRGLSLLQSHPAAHRQAGPSTGHFRPVAVKPRIIAVNQGLLHWGKGFNLFSQETAPVVSVWSQLKACGVSDHTGLSRRGLGGFQARTSSA